MVIDAYRYMSSFHLSFFFLIEYLISQDSVLQMIYVPFSFKNCKIACHLQPAHVCLHTLHSVQLLAKFLIIVVWQEYNFSISWGIYSKLLIYISIIFSFTAVSFGWKKKEFELSNALLICVGWYDQQDRTDAEIWNKFKKSICIS